MGTIIINLKATQRALSLSFNYLFAAKLCISGLEIAHYRPTKIAVCELDRTNE